MTDQRRFFSLSMAGALLFFGCLWLLDFPKPFVDDLFYSGAGLNLATGHDLSNPLLARQGFPSHFFFVYPPLQSYVLAGWLKIFGISAAAMTGLQMLLYLIIAVATIAILRRHRAPPWLEWLVPLAVATSFLRLGLRPESLAAALGMAGFALIECGCKRSLPVFCAFWLMFLGASAAPRMAPFIGAMVFLAGYRLQSGSSAAGGRRWTVVALAAAALAATLVVFLFMINFHLGEFWRTFHLHASRLSYNKFKMLVQFLVESWFLDVTQWPLLLLLAELLVFTLYQPKAESTWTAMAILCAFPIVVLIGGLGAGTVWFVSLVVLILAVSVLKNVHPTHALALKVALGLLFVLANTGSLVQALGQAGGRIKTERGEQYQAALALQSTGEHPLLVDGATARYVFDYRLPPGCLDIQFAVPFPKVFIASEFRAGDIFAIGPEAVEVLNMFTMLNQAIDRWAPLACSKHALDKFPRQVFVIPQEACKGPRWEPAPEKAKSPADSPK